MIFLFYQIPCLFSTTPGTQLPDEPNLKIKDIVTVNRIAFATIGAGHAVYKVTICDKDIFYLDNGWWNHISEANHWEYWTLQEELL